MSLRFSVKVFLPVIAGVVFTLVFLLFARHEGSVVAMSAASANIRYVAVTGNDTGNDCTNSSTPCATIQRAVDQAAPEDEVRVAGGDYTGSSIVTHTDGFTYTQVVFIAKSLTLRGGYSTDSWDNSNSNENQTVINAGGAGRGITIIDTNDNPVAVEGFKITGGDYTGLGNGSGGPNDVCRSVDDCGGGLFVKNSAANLKNLLIDNNNAGSGDSQGGGMYLWSVHATTVDSVTLSHNTAEAGGGLLVTSQYFPLTITGSTFQNNVVKYSGGGLYLRSNIQSLVTVENCQFFDNIANEDDGGGINARLAANGLMLKLDKILMRGNQADEHGFAIYLDAAGNVTPEASLSNIILAGNKRVTGTTDEPEDAVISVAPNFTNLVVDMEHITAADNPVASFLYAEPAYDAGEYVTVTVSNTLLSGFTYGFTAKEEDDTEVTVQHTNTLFYNVDYMHNTLGGTPTFTATNPIYADPKLRSDYHLNQGSGAIDVGIETGLPDDIDGNARPYGIAPDIGADEFVEIYLYLPMLNKD